MRKLLAATLSGVLVLGACADGAPRTTGPELEASYAAGSNGAASGNKLQCFSGADEGYNGTCTLITDGASINTVDGDGDPNNNYAGVYIPMNNLGGKLIGEVNKLSFTYSGSGAVGGSPRFSVPIDSDGNGSFNDWAYIDTMGCNTGNVNVGTADAINDATCTVTYANVGYANWQAFAAANPTYRISTQYIAFIIVDQAGTFTITNVQLGRGTAKAK